MKIIRLEAANIKRLKAIQITPDGKPVVIISGKNDSGKSSTLDSISYALGGKEEICEEPLRKGAAKGHVICDLGDIVVERKFSKSGSSVIVSGKDGALMKSPQAILDSLCSHVAFDPLSFVRMKPAEQKATLSQLVGLDFTELEKKRKLLYDERTVVGREVLSAKSRLQAAPYHKDASPIKVSIAGLMEELDAATKRNAANAYARSLVKRRQEEVERSVKALNVESLEVFRLETELTARKDRLKQAETEHNALAEVLLKETASSLKLVDANDAEIRGRVETAEAANKAVDANSTYLAIKDQLEGYEEMVEKMTAQIEKLDAEKVRQLSEAKFPMPGLSFDEAGVLLNDVPFTQGSQARQLQAAVAIGLALNPKVKVILIRDGSLLDDDSMKMVADMAAKAEAQIWVEVVNSQDPSAIVIEDGEIKEGA